MAEFRLTAPEEGAAVDRRGGWKEWRFTLAQGAALKAACLSIVPTGKGVENVLRSIDINTRRPRKAPAGRSLDLSWNRFVVQQIGKMPRRALAHEVWALCCEKAGRGSGVVQAGLRELAREMDVAPSHVAEVIGDLCRMKALIRRAAWPDGPDFVVNAYVLPEAGGLLLQLEQEEHGKPVPFVRRARGDG